jgi:hypothetical protein
MVVERVMYADVFVKENGVSLSGNEKDKVTFQVESFWLFETIPSTWFDIGFEMYVKSLSI